MKIQTGEVYYWEGQNWDATVPVEVPDSLAIALGLMPPSELGSDELGSDGVVNNQIISFDPIAIEQVEAALLGAGIRVEDIQRALRLLGSEQVGSDETINNQNNLSDPERFLAEWSGLGLDPLSSVESVKNQMITSDPTAPELAPGWREAGIGVGEISDALKALTNPPSSAAAALEQLVPRSSEVGSDETINNIKVPSDPSPSDPTQFEREEFAFFLNSVDDPQVLEVFPTIGKGTANRLIQAKGDGEYLSWADLLQRNEALTRSPFQLDWEEVFSYWLEQGGKA